MGTPSFALNPLQKLIDNKYDVAAVFCQPDKPQGRHMVLTPPPVKVLAEKYSLPVFQPKTLKETEPQEIIKNLNPDVIVVAAYGKLLPKVVLETPKYGCINIHGSLLPKYRGAAPIQRCVMNNEKYSGITIMQMAEGMDTGDILLQEKVEIGKDETSGELFDRLSIIGSDLLLKALENIDNLKPIKQNENEATHAAMLSKADSILDLTKSPEEVYALIRGLTPWPGAFTEYKGKRIKIIKAKLENGVLEYVTVQPDGKKPMPFKDFLNGIKS